MQLEFLPDKIKARRQYYFFFGSHTVENDLHIQGIPYCTSRYFDDHNCLRYTDYGLILQAPIAPLVQKKNNPFRNAAPGGAVIAELSVDGGYELAGWGGFAYCVVVRRGDFSTVEGLSLVEHWQQHAEGLAAIKKPAEPH